MKLRNKKTGEIADLSEGFIRDTYNGSMIQIKPVAISNKEGYVYDSLAELNEEWEDYEEPKTFWAISWAGEPEEYDAKNTPEELKNMAKQIGNYFETKEEAEKAVEKLRAWKRLKDKGFRFILDGETEMPMFVYSGANGEKCITSAEESKQCRDDIKLLFGGEK